MEQRHRKLNDDSLNMFGVTDMMAGVEQSQSSQIIVPVATDADGVTWVGHIGMSPTGLVLPDNLDQQEWAAFFNVIRDVKTSWQLIIGDWFAYGNEHFKVSYKEIADATGYSESSVETFASVCRNVPQLIRINSLVFGHYQKVASQPLDVQMAALKMAADERWSVRQLGDYLKGVKQRRLGSKTVRLQRFNIVDKREFSKLKKAAPDERKRVAAELRRLADELEQGIGAQR